MADTRPEEVSKLLERVLRADQGRLLGALVASVQDLSLAQDALQDAALSALSHWPRTGIPASPQGWLLTVARRKAIDRLRGAARNARKAEALGHAAPQAHEDPEPASIPDHRLRLLFTCCHPSLEPKSRVALTLRMVCGLSTAEIARAFLDAEPTMGQRLSRAKAKVAAAGIPFTVPEAHELPSRLDTMLTTIYLIFTTGYVLGPAEPRDLCAEAEYLLGVIDRLHPGHAEVEGAMAMMLLTSARRHARVGPDGASVPPAQQDQTRWDWPRIHQGRALLQQAMQRRCPGPFQIKAAIADCHMQATGPDWPQLVALYGALLKHEPTPVVRLNAAVALGEAGDPAEALRMVEALAVPLAHYQPWHATHAAMLARAGDIERAQAAYLRAIEGAPGPAEALFLRKKWEALRDAGRQP